MNKKVRKITDGAMMIAIVGAILLLDRQLGNILTYYLMFLWPLPMVFYATKYGHKDSWVVFTAMSLVALIVSTPDNAFYVISESVLGLVYGSGVHDDRSMRRLIIVAMLVGVFVNLVDTVLIMKLLGYSLDMQTEELVTMFDQVRAQAGVSLPQTVDLHSMMRSIVLISAVVTGVMQGYVTHVMSRFMLKRLGFHVAMPQPFLTYYAPKWTGYAAIAGFILYNWSLGHPFEVDLVQTLVQTLGIFGYMYLLFYGFFANVAVVASRSRSLKALAVIVSFLLIFVLPFMLVILGFLYITTQLHDRILEGAYHAA